MGNSRFGLGVGLIPWAIVAASLQPSCSDDNGTSTTGPSTSSAGGATSVTTDATSTGGGTASSVASTGSSSTDSAASTSAASTGGSASTSSTGNGTSSSASTGAGGEAPTIVTGPNGAEVDIPAGAVADPSSIKVTVAASGYPTLPTGATLEGSVYALTPHGTQFSQSVEVIIPFTGSDVPTLYTAEMGDTTWTAVAGATVVGKTLHASVDHFSYFAPILPAIWHDITGTVDTSQSGASLVFACGKLYAATTTVYVSSDSGANWTGAGAGLPSGIIYNMATQPGTNWLFASTPQGVYRTSCANISWTAMNAAANGWPQDATFHTPLRPEEVDATASAVFVSVDSNNQSNNQPLGGLYKSSDSGATWTRLNGFVNYVDSSSNVASFAFNGSSIYGGTISQGLEASTDGGATWSTSQPDQPQDPVFAVLVNGGQVLASSDDGIFRSATGTGNWTKVFSSFEPVHALVQTGGRVYADLGYKGIGYSDDQGTTWTSYSAGLPFNINNDYVVRYWRLATDGALLVGSPLNGVSSTYRIYAAPVK